MCMCMYMCVYVCICMYMYVYVCLRMSMYAHVCHAYLWSQPAVERRHASANAPRPFLA